MRMRHLVLALIVFVGGVEFAFAQSPTLSTRRVGVPTVWVASEALLVQQDLDLSLSVPIGWVVVASRIEEHEGDYILYNDPSKREWVTCDQATGVCKRPDGVSAPILFVWMGPVNEYSSSEPLISNSPYTTYSVQVRNGSPVRFRVRYAIEIQPAGVATHQKQKK